MQAISSAKQNQSLDTARKNENMIYEDVSNWKLNWIWKIDGLHDVVGQNGKGPVELGRFTADSGR